ncbi:hypothetical protein GZ77_06980 [Endozoicomonas montiporae]|uniref:Amine oxidase domain-containing protein n=2 Tax=Endozoicomonas montiporae TaxID=1027273 RepID=A0A081N6V6_9GAMM|nr:NAD(P)-binding protein [Endozoicomonas montiporae]AMO56519.1 FAD dependent oxidoreductase [Endozoicomonas montiporae CL-33]KEQ14179.1 hypothetical protein GZ77_06980 [Endozoicomonas montiporae]
MNIAVTGAGLSGIKVGSLLHKMGHNVTVFEKSRGLGGRLAHRRLNWADIDLGAQYFTARDPDFIKEVNDWCRQGSASLWNFTPYCVRDNQLSASPDDTLRYIGQPLMNQPVHHLAAGMTLKLGVTINQVVRKDKWILYGANEALFSGFDWLIMTQPAEQARKLLQGVSDIVTSIPDTVHEPCWALGLGTLGNVPEEIQGIFGDSTVRWASRLSSRPGFQNGAGVDDVWMLHFASEWSERQGKQTEVNIAQAGTLWLQNLLGRSVKPVHEYCHFWRYASIKSNEQATAYKVDESQKLALIGSWCSGGRVEGAWLSAISLFNDLFR